MTRTHASIWLTTFGVFAMAQAPAAQAQSVDVGVEATLISSPSKTSLRFLAHRQPVELPAPAPVAAGNPTLSLRLLWDGQDHRKQIAGPGAYSYEVRIKLLGQTEKGLRTMMVAWPKRGTVEVK